jgi:hypothetical protein
VVDDPLLAPLLTEGATCAREAMVSVGTCGRRHDRQLAEATAGAPARRRWRGGGVGDGKHLRGLIYMWRLARPGGQAVANEAAT